MVCRFCDRDRDDPDGGVAYFIAWFPFFPILQTVEQTMARALVIGGTQLIGRALVEQLLAALRPLQRQTVAEAPDSHSTDLPYPEYPTAPP